MVALIRQDQLQELAHIWVVLDHENGGCVGSGSSNSVATSVL